MSTSSGDVGRCVCSAAEDPMMAAALQCQKASDVMISLAYLSIPLELFYFVPCSTLLPFRFLLLLFSSFIVLCGLSHLLSALHRPLIPLTLLKLFTALISSATSISLATLLPHLLRLLVREGLLLHKTHHLRLRIRLLRLRLQASWRARLLTHRLRLSLHPDTILRTSLLELSSLLSLRHCSLWSPLSLSSSLLRLTHHLSPSPSSPPDLPSSHPDVAAALSSSQPLLLPSGPSPLLSPAAGPTIAARVRLPGGSASYALLVLEMPAGDGRRWGEEELEIVEVVADQIGVALSHAATYQDSLRDWERRLEENVGLRQAHRSAAAASESRAAFATVMGHVVAAPARSISAIVGVLGRDDRLSPGQRRIVDGMAKSSLLFSGIFEDVLWASGPEHRSDSGRLRISPFSLHSALEQAVGISGLLCHFQGLKFDFDISRDLPDIVIGDEKCAIKALIYMVRVVASACSGSRGSVSFRVCREHGSGDERKKSKYNDFVQLRIEVSRSCSGEELNFSEQGEHEECSEKASAHGLCLTICEKLAQLLHGNISSSSDPQDADSFNKFIMRKLVDEIGCHLTVAHSWFHCLETLLANRSEFHLLLIDLCFFDENMHDMSALRIQSEKMVFVIAMASKVDFDTRERCLQNGMNGVIGKPVILDELVVELQRIIRKATQVPSPPFLTERQEFST